MVWRVLVMLALVVATQPFADDSAVRVTQLTHGPRHHFFGYIGQSKTIPWSGDGRYILALETTFQERMPKAGDAANICLIDTHNDNAVRVIERTLAWNPQQGTMFYWHPSHPQTQFFFNDRDPRTNKVFTVLYDISADGGKGRRLREFRYDDTPVGNGGVAPNGEFFTAINYARMARLRPVTGYPDAWDWTVGVAAPKDDGIFRIDIATGRKSLIVSFADLREAVRDLDPKIDSSQFFINHTLNNRDSNLIYFFARANFESQELGTRINSPFTVRPDGTGLTRHDTFIGGHPEWALGTRIIGSANREQVVYDVERKAIAESWGGPERFPNPEGDVALSPDGKWFVNGHREGEHHIYTFLQLESKRVLKSPPIYLAKWNGGPLRLDPAPAWNRTSDAIVVPGIAADGTRQMFALRLPK